MLPTLSQYLPKFCHSHESTSSFVLMDNKVESQQVESIKNITFV